MKRAANMPFVATSEEDVREIRANLTGFFAILIEWNAAQSPSVASVDEEPVLNNNRGRKPKP